VRAINPGEEKQRNRRKLTEGTEWALDRETRVPSQLTVEAVVNQFRQLLENDGKRTEIEILFRSLLGRFPCQWPFHQRFP
jgi:hypothetical protein